MVGFVNVVAKKAGKLIQPVNETGEARNAAKDWKTTRTRWGGVHSREFEDPSSGLVGQLPEVLHSLG